MKADGIRFLCQVRGSGYSLRDVRPIQVDLCWNTVQVNCGDPFSLLDRDS